MTYHIKPGPDGPGLFSFITLGCKSNQYDSAAMAAELESAGLSRGSVKESGVIVINTCTVTGPAEAQCRKAIRQARRANGKATLVVSGCMAVGSKKLIAQMDEVDLVIEPSEKGMLPRFLGLNGSDDWTDWPVDPAVDLGERDRGFLKVQDGCNAHCTYCIVPLVRGRSRSLDPVAVLDAVRRLMERGVQEVVLSGIHLGQYGGDLDPVCSLEKLLAMFLHDAMPGRLRLSSIEPLEITPGLVEILAGADGRICRHLHIPLQSGSDRILGAMGRPYTSEQFAEAVDTLTGSVPGIGIGCDVICGFPGETSEDFWQTYELIEQFEIPFIHAFPFSPRSGTSAANMKDNVPHHVKKERVVKLRELAMAHRRAFARSFVDQVLEAALESRTDAKGRTIGLSDNYLQIAIVEPGEDAHPGRIVGVYIESTEDDLLVGQLHAK